MPEITIKELFPEPWGISQSRRKEIEYGGYGTFDKVVKEEIHKHFMHIEQVAKAMDCHKNTAGKRLRDHEPRYIIHDGQRHYYRPDIDTILAERQAAEKSKAEEKLKEALKKKQRKPRRLDGKTVDKLYNSLKGNKYVGV